MPTLDIYTLTRNNTKKLWMLLKIPELEPSDPAILNTLGLSYENLKQYDDAIHAYQEAISIKPDYVNATIILKSFLT